MFSFSKLANKKSIKQSENFSAYFYYNINFMLYILFKYFGFSIHCFSVNILNKQFLMHYKCC